MWSNCILGSLITGKDKPGQFVYECILVYTSYKIFICVKCPESHAALCLDKEFRLGPQDDVWAECMSYSKNTRKLPSWF